MTTGYVIGIDIGTGSLKAVAVSEAGEAMSSVSKAYPTAYTPDGFNEQQPELIWQAFVFCMHELQKKINSPLIAVSLSSAMHSILAIDADGIPITSAIICSDVRSASIANALKNSTQGEDFYKVTGTPIHAMSPLCKIKWLKENKPDVFAKAYKFISIKEYIWWKLFGKYEVDFSIASATGLFDIKNLGWYDKALHWAGIKPTQLSTPVATEFSRNETTPVITSLLNLPANTPFIIGASDGCLANVGTFATLPGTAALTIGSSGAIRVSSKVPILHFPSMPFSYRLDKNSYICGGPINNGGIVIQWLLQSFFKIKQPSAKEYTIFFEEINTVAAGCEGLIFLPYLTGERAPVWDAASCGTFFGLRRHHTATHMMRAAVEGVCFAIYETLEMIDVIAPIHQLQVSGGITHSEIWMQMLADITGKKLCLVQTEDASAVGAAYLALQTFDIHFEPSKPPKIIEPCRENHNRHQKNFSVYKLLYPSLKEAMHVHQLNQ